MALKFGMWSSIGPNSSSGGAESSPIIITRRDISPPFAGATDVMRSLEIAHEPELFQRLGVHVHNVRRRRGGARERLGPRREHAFELLRDVGTLVDQIH